MAKSKQHTICGYTTKKSVVWLVIDGKVNDEIVREQYDLYRNDEAGQMFKDEDLQFWEQIN